MQSDSHSGKRVPALAAHGTVGAVSTASVVEGSALAAGCSALQTLSGWQVVMSPGILRQQGDFAGAPEVRAADFLEMWQRDDVGAILCARGGYGSNYLLPLLDFDALASAPKAFVGYSDNTSLLLALNRADIVSFHGPMLASDFATGRADERSFLAALTGNPLDFEFAAGASVQPIIAGEAHATITGGCLSVVVASLGTPWEIDTTGKIVFLEDVNEKPFRIDRMLMQLLLAGKFQHARGIIFGAMLGCAPASPLEETLPQMIRRILGGLGIPIVFGFPSGHVASGNLTLPFGVPALLHSSETGVRLHVGPATLISNQLTNQ